ncbi:MAG TPA: response regulator transcription factor [Trueperaceae bacterium]|nr:response regulator transcription factor [Trueperaceae bacterium]
MTSSVYLVEDHPVIQRALNALLEAESDLTVSGIAGTAEEALELIPLGSTDIVLIDVSLPGMSGLALAARLMGSKPTFRTLMVTGHNDVHYARAALAAGANGYVLKDDPNEIIVAVRAVLAGGIYLSMKIRDQVER